MNTTIQTNDEQTALWNGTAGRAWVDAQAIMDQMFKTFEDMLVAAVRAESAERVLDVGCGTGSSTIAVAQHADCTGIDISEPMTTLARDRAKRKNSKADFICADAQGHTFEPASFDMIISRFGVMFFSNFVAAFANLRHATRNNGKLQLIAWRSPEENPFMTTAERTAAPLLPNLPARKPGAPGQFAFANKNRVYDILKESGWSEISIEPIDVACAFPESELLRYITRFGPLGLILNETDERTHHQIIETVRRAFDPYVQGTEVRFNAACWMIGARAHR